MPGVGSRQILGEGYLDLKAYKTKQKVESYTQYIHEAIV